MTCNCCNTDLPNYAKTLLCPKCMNALVLNFPKPGQIQCKVHGNAVDPRESQRT